MPHSDNLPETILFSIQDPVLAVDEQLSIVLANPAALALDKSLEGQHVIEWLSPFVGLDAIAMLNKCFSAGSPFTFDLQAGKEIYSCRTTPLRGDQSGWVLVFHEITRLKQNDAMKSRMLHMMSHDLKNPLAAIGGLTQMLIRKFEGYSDRQKEYLEQIADNAVRMDSLITAVLDLELVRSALPNLQMVELGWLFRRLTNEFEPQAQDRGHTLEINMPEERLSLFADEAQLYQALSNLVDNAIKFTPDNGRIIIRTVRNANSTLVKISDNGYGVSEALQPRLFEPFYRALNQKTMGIPGNGIGLSLVKAVVEGHGGKVWFESVEDQGTTFFVELPVVEGSKEGK